MNTLTKWLKKGRKEYKGKSENDKFTCSHLEEDFSYYFPWVC